MTSGTVAGTRPRTPAPAPARGRWGAAATRLRHNPLILASYAVLIINTVSCLIPILWTLSNSFRTNTQIFTRFSLIPEQFNLGGYTSIIDNTNLVQAFVNSLIITVAALVILLICVLPGAFVLARFRFRFSRALYTFFLLSIFVPSIVLLQAIYELFTRLNLLNVPYAIVLAYAAVQLPFCLFLLVAYMREIPAEVEEAAIIDGAGVWSIFRRVIVPMSRNGIVVVLILSFVAIWNDYVYALVFLPQPQRQTLTVALANVKGEYTVSYAMLSAAAIMAIVPVFVFYLFTKNLLMSGMSEGAVKG
jgi:raffinose/stachyose/melibiose transport system permease protein